jgi:hypothetical protein
VHPISHAPSRHPRPGAQSLGPLQPHTFDAPADVPEERCSHSPPRRTTFPAHVLDTGRRGAAARAARLRSRRSPTWRDHTRPPRSPRSTRSRNVRRCTPCRRYRPRPPSDNPAGPRQALPGPTVRVSRCPPPLAYGPRVGPWRRFRRRFRRRFPPPLEPSTADEREEGEERADADTEALRRSSNERARPPIRLAIQFAQSRDS